MLYDDDPKLRIGREIQKDKGKIVMEFTDLVKKHAQLDAEKRVYQKAILKDLEATKSSSFTAKIKSFFVGNSKEYNRAIKALEDASTGSIPKEEAARAIKDYLDIRKNKVRDHQYGRDRFDGMMMGLRTLMDPQEFADYCKDVDAARHERDKNYNDKTVPAAYKTEKERAYENEVREKENALKEKQRLENLKLEEAKKDPDRLKADLESGKYRVQRNEKFLNHLRNLNSQNTQAVKDAENYITEHPTVRAEAMKLNKELGLNLDISYLTIPDQPNKNVDGPKKSEDGPSAQSGGAPSAQ